MEAPSQNSVGIVGRPYLTLLEAYRGIASVAVVLHHVGAIAFKHYKITFMGGFFSACHLRLDFFFVLSGFIIAWLHDQDLGKPRTAMPFLVKRLCRIYPLLFLLTTVKLITLLSLGAWFRTKEHLDLQLIISSYLMLPSEHFPIILAAWTMPYELAFYLLFTGAIYTSRRVLTFVVLTWSAVILASHWQAPFEAPPPPFLLEPFHLQLMVGMGVGLLVKQYGRLAWGKPLMIVGFSLLAAGLLMHNWIESWPMLHARCWWALVFCLIIPGSALFELNRTKPLRIPVWLKELGRASYSTYLLHSPILVVLLALCARWDLFHSSWKDAAMMGAVVIAVIAGLIGHRWVERPLAQWTRRWTHDT